MDVLSVYIHFLPISFFDQITRVVTFGTKLPNLLFIQEQKRRKQKRQDIFHTPEFAYEFYPPF